jgi:hypothetical protein
MVFCQNRFLDRAPVRAEKVQILHILHNLFLVSEVHDSVIHSVAIFSVYDFQNFRGLKSEFLNLFEIFPYHVRLNSSFGL